MDMNTKRNIWYATSAMNTIAQYIIMKDITIMDFQSVTIMHAMNVMIRYLVRFKLGLVDDKIKAYEGILEVINGRTEREGKNKTTTINFYEAARIAYTNGQYMRKYLDSKIRDIAEINKCYRPIWEFTYRMLYEDKKRIKVVNKDPDSLLVSWVPGGMTLAEILEANKAVVVWE